MTTLNHAQLMAVVWTLWSLGFSSTVGRIVLRWKIQGSFRAEDYLAIAAFVFLTALCAVVTGLAPIFEMTQQYLLEAASDPLTPLPLPYNQYIARTETALKLMFAQMLLFWSTLWGGKFSLLVFFRQMVLGIPKYLRIWWLVFTLVLLTYLACMLSNFLTCVPLHKYWSATGCSAPEDLKRSDVSIKFATSADVFADFLIMVLPLRLLWTLRISLKQKLGLALLFCLGSIVIAFAFFRLSQVTKATSNAKLDPVTMADGPIILSLWTTIEASVAVIVANIPAFRSLLRSHNSTQLSTSDRNKASVYPTLGSRTNTSKSGTRRTPLELESLHSFEDDIFGKGRIQSQDFVMGKKQPLSDRTTEIVE